MPRQRSAIAVAIAIVVAHVIADACGVDFLPRSHYNDALWRPLSRHHASFAAAPGVVLPGAFAGMRTPMSTAPLDVVREAYQRLVGVRDTGDADGGTLVEAVAAAIAAARLASPDAAARDELDLVALKVRLRALERDIADEGWANLAKAFETFLARSLTPEMASEARGWLARCLHMAGDRASAAKIYLDELARPATVFSTESLTLSLQMLYRWNGTDTGLLDDVEAFFDTPSHAVFAVTLLTNPVPNEEVGEVAGSATAEALGRARRVYRDRIASRAITVLEARRDLFRGPDGDHLAALLMRAALYRGDAEAALRYHERLSPSSALRGDPDVRWEHAAALSVAGRLGEARGELQRILDDPSLKGTAVQRTAARGVVGLSMQLGDNVEALRAAFLRAPGDDRPMDEVQAEQLAQGRFAARWLIPVPEGWAWSIDLPYLLDVWMSDAELDRARREWPASLLALPSAAGAWNAPRLTVGQEIDYARAVRRARATRFAEAAVLYERAGNAVRAARMRRAATAFARASAPGASAADRISYAQLLADQPERLLFHDRLYSGYQRLILATSYGCWSPPCPPVQVEAALSAMPPEVRRAYVRRERRLRDRQEERWQAVQVLLPVVDADRGTDDGRAAARLALECLGRITTERFGREAEVAALQRRLRTWLRTHPA